jgi:hypothetical protein
MHITGIHTGVQDRYMVMCGPPATVLRYWHAQVAKYLGQRDSGGEALHINFKAPVTVSEVVL